MITPRRVKQLAVKAEFIAKLMTGIYEVTHSDVPIDAKIVGLITDERSGLIRILLEHESFPELLEGWMAPHVAGPTIRCLVEVKSDVVTVETGDARRRIQLKEVTE